MTGIVQGTSLSSHTAKSVKHQVSCPLPTLVPQTLGLTTYPDLCSFRCPSLPFCSHPGALSGQTIARVPHDHRRGPSNQPHPSPVYQCQDVKHSGHVRMAVARTPLQVLQGLAT